MQSVSPTMSSMFSASASNDLNDFLNSDLLFSSPSPSSSSTSVETPPQSAPLNSFPDIYSTPSDSLFGELNVQSDLFNFLQGSTNMKGSSSNSFDQFLDAFGSNPSNSMGIDPSLFSTSPAAASTSSSSSTSPAAESPIEPIKVGGHGKARKGTVQGGGVTKRTPAATKNAAPPKEKENDHDDDEEDLDGDIPASWRPAPEVYAKMTSKEKRQLRNKISARNFRVRRKEYISTLELDIAERDRLLTAIRSELGSTQSENQALRREIDALKDALMGSRNIKQERDSSPILSSSSFSTIVASPKDILSSPSWGGLMTAKVHTVLMPEWGNKGLQENINPALNASAQTASQPAQAKGFDGFIDGNAFTLKNLDAYRMHLWTKMAAQNPHNTPPLTNLHSFSPSPSPSPGPSTPPQMFSPHLPLPDPRFSPSPFTNPSLPYLTGSPTLTGLASNMGVKFFRDGKAPLTGASLGEILAGKTGFKKPAGPAPTPEQAFIATLAHQTLFKRLGGAFWDAFSGESSPSSRSTAPTMDSDKVRKVLEGKAVVRVVDVETPSKAAPRHSSDVCSILEESMRSLTISKK